MRDIKEILSNIDVANLLNNVEDQKNKTDDIKEKYIIERDYSMICLIAFYGLTIKDINKINSKNLMLSYIPYISFENRKVEISYDLISNIMKQGEYFREINREAWQKGESIFDINEIDFNNQIQKYKGDIAKEINFKELRTYCISSLMNGFANLNKLTQYLGIDSIEEVMPYYVGFPNEIYEIASHNEGLVMMLRTVEDK